MEERLLASSILESEIPIAEMARLSEPFPEEPELRLKQCLSVINTSPKCVTMFLIPGQGQFIEPKELRKEFARVNSGSVFEAADTRTAEVYCQYSLKPHGMLIEEISFIQTGSRRVLGYSLTEAGEKYGKPAAAIALLFEFQNKFSLFEVFGSSNEPKNTGNSSPYVRAKILTFLFELQASARLAHIAKELHLSESSVSNSLRALVASGVVEYEFAHPNSERFKNRRTHSGARINEKGELVVTEVLRPIDKLVSDNEDSGNNTKFDASQIVEANLPGIASEVLPLYYPHSHMGKTRERQSIKNLLILNIARYPERSALTELAQLSHLHPTAVMKSIVDEIRSGTVIYIKLGGVNYLSLSDSDHPLPAVTVL